MKLLIILLSICLMVLISLVAVEMYHLNEDKKELKKYLSDTINKKNNLKQELEYKKNTIKDYTQNLQDKKEENKQLNSKLKQHNNTITNLEKDILLKSIHQIVLTFYCELTHNIYTISSFKYFSILRNAKTVSLKKYEDLL